MNIAWPSYRTYASWVNAINQGDCRCMRCVWVDEAGLPPSFIVCVVTGRPVAMRCFLCVECLESRLGRELVLDDPTDAPVNIELRELLQRLVPSAGFEPALSGF